MQSKDHSLVERRERNLRYGKAQAKALAVEFARSLLTGKALLDHNGKRIEIDDSGALTILK